MRRKKPDHAEACGTVSLNREGGLNPAVATRITEVARGFASKVNLKSESGTRADASSLLELLLLGSRPGDSLEVHCVGTDANAAFAAVSALLAAKGET